MNEHLQKIIDDAAGLNKRAAAGMRDAANQRRGDSLTEPDRHHAAVLWQQAQELDAEADKIDPPE